MALLCANGCILLIWDAGSCIIACMQVHLALTGDPKEMRVSWKTAGTGSVRIHISYLLLAGLE
jgi:hypothetical protein